MVAAALPDLDQLDIEALKALVVAQRKSLYSHTQQVEHLKLVIEKLRRVIFGAKSEKVIVQVEQFELQLEEAETEQAADEEEMESPASEAESQLQSRPARKPLPAHLPREVVTHHPDQDCCPDCGGQLRNFGEDAAEMLEYIPANFKVIRHVRPKFACKQCERVVEAAAPSRTIERGVAGPGLLAHVLVAKYADHCPLYRQSEIYAREGIDLDRSTLAGWELPVSYLRRWLMLCASMCYPRPRFMPTIRRFRYSLPVTEKPRRAASGLMCEMNVPPVKAPRLPCGSPTRRIVRANIRGST